MMQYRLADIFDLQMGKTPDRHNYEYWNEGTEPWISISDLTKSGKYITETTESITKKGVEECGMKLIPEKTVIMSFKLSIGKAAITEKPIFSNEAIMAFIDKGLVKVDPVYLYYLFTQRNWDAGTNKAVMGKTLNKATLSDVIIKIDDYDKQIIIRNNLDRISKIIEIKKIGLDELDTLIKARFVEMFGDLADQKCKHPHCKLVEACENPNDIKCGPFGTQLSKDEYQNSGVAVWEIPQINSGFVEKPTHYLAAKKADDLKAYSIVPGDIAMSRKGNVGRCGIFPDNYEPGIIHSDVLRIRVDDNKVNPIFMMGQLHFSRTVQYQIEMVSSGAIMAGVNVTKLKQIDVKIPNKELQDQYAEFVNQVDKSKFVDLLLTL